VKPLVEFNNMNRLAAAPACFEFARLVGISKGDNHIPPPIPTIPAIVPRETPIGTLTTAICLILRFDLIILALCNSILEPKDKSEIDAAKRASAKIKARVIIRSTNIPPKKANGMDARKGKTSLGTK
jgi:hypothetical protein